MKKVLALALTLVMVFGMFAVASFAADEEIIVKATATAGKTGETITLKVETTQVNTPYGGFDVIVQYDPAVVKPVLTNEDLEADRDLYNSIIALIDVPFKNVDINVIINAPILTPTTLDLPPAAFVPPTNAAATEGRK